MYQRIESNITDGVGRIWLNRPEKRNALDRVMVDELYDCIQKFQGDDSLRVIVIGGRGTAFCSGADLDYLRKLLDYSLEENTDDSNALARMLHAIYNVTVPVIARVHGPAIAGGCGLATVCDIVVANRNARFGYSEVSFGFIPAIVMAFLLRRVSHAQASQLLLTGQIIDAQAAVDVGLASTFIDADDEATLDGCIDELVRKIQSSSAGAIKRTKAMLSTLDGMEISSSLDYAVRMNVLTRMTDDFREGLSRILAK